MFRLIQLPLKSKLRTPEEQLETKFDGHHHAKTNIEIEIEMAEIETVKLHVDTHQTFQERMNATTQFGGDLSVRMPPHAKPLICWGQDECIFKQFLFAGKAWTAPDGQKPVIPKDEGLGAMMMSDFVSREFGFGMKLSLEDLQTVNQCRQGKNCRDKSAALDKRGTFAKQPLRSSPFVTGFGHGVNAEGCWTHCHMVLQFKDCINVVKTLHPD
jgi:hypothetical protein